MIRQNRPNPAERDFTSYLLKGSVQPAQQALRAQPAQPAKRAQPAQRAQRDNRLNGHNRQTDYRICLRNFKLRGSLPR